MNEQKWKNIKYIHRVKELMAEKEKEEEKERKKKSGKKAKRVKKENKMNGEEIINKLFGTKNSTSEKSQKS